MTWFASRAATKIIVALLSSHNRVMVRHYCREYFWSTTNQYLKRQSAFGGGKHDWCGVECRCLRGADFVHCRVRCVGSEASSVTHKGLSLCADLNKRNRVSCNGQARREAWSRRPCALRTWQPPSVPHEAQWSSALYQSPSINPGENERNSSWALALRPHARLSAVQQNLCSRHQRVAFCNTVRWMLHKPRFKIGQAG